MVLMGYLGASNVDPKSWFRCIERLLVVVCSIDKVMMYDLP